MENKIEIKIPRFQDSKIPRFLKNSFKWLLFNLLLAQKHKKGNVFLIFPAFKNLTHIAAYPPTIKKN
jgi:hypothetical protein